MLNASEIYLELDCPLELMEACTALENLCAFNFHVYGGGATALFTFEDWYHIQVILRPWATVVTLASEKNIDLLERKEFKIGYSDEGYLQKISSIVEKVNKILLSKVKINAKC